MRYTKDKAEADRVLSTLVPKSCIRNERLPKPWSEFKSSPPKASNASQSLDLSCMETATFFRDPRKPRTDLDLHVRWCWFADGWSRFPPGWPAPFGPDLRDSQAGIEISRSPIEITGWYRCTWFLRGASRWEPTATWLRQLAPGLQRTEVHTVPTALKKRADLDSRLADGWSWFTVCWSRFPPGATSTLRPRPRCFPSGNRDQRRLDRDQRLGHGFLREANRWEPTATRPQQLAPSPAESTTDAALTWRSLYS